MAQGKSASNNLVYIFVGSVLAIAVIVLVFRLLLHNPCPELVISISPEEIYHGDVVTFYDSLSDSDKREWVFDNGAQTLSDRQVKNVFQPGIHTVTLMIDKKCITTRQFTVLPARKDTTTPEPIPETAPLAKVEISGPKIAYVNEWARFKGSGDGATEWQWQFSETGMIDSRVQNPSYKFKTPGRKLVTMTINGGNSEIANFVVEVKVRDKKPAPTPGPSPTPTPAAPKYPDVSDKEFETLLYELVSGDRDCPAFAKYFCNGAGSTPVNSKFGTQAFSTYCSKLKNSNPSHITVTLKKNKSTNCIEEITVKQR